jgi:hypothetical protein
MAASDGRNGRMIELHGAMGWNGMMLKEMCRRGDLASKRDHASWRDIISHYIIFT